MAEHTEKIGFIGLGIMGKPMVRHLLAAGYAVTVYNRSPGAVDELTADGATPAESVAELAANSDIVITMLPDTPDVESVALESEGIFARGRAGLLFIDMSTISPVATRRIAKEAAARDVSMLDAPVSGGQKGAVDAALSIMAGGEEKDFERALPIFNVLGKTVVHCGGSGAGQVVKACNQIVVALIIEAISEALVLGSKAGVNPELILKVLGGGLAQSRLMDVKGPNMIRHSFEPGFKAALHRKDLGIILETANQYGVELPAAKVVSALFDDLISQGKGNLDHSALLTVIERLSGHMA